MEQIKAFAFTIVNLHMGRSGSSKHKLQPIKDSYQNG